MSSEFCFSHQAAFGPASSRYAHWAGPQKSSHWQHPPGHSHPCWEGKKIQIVNSPNMYFPCLSFSGLREKLRGKNWGGGQEVKKAINQLKWMTVERKLWGKNVQRFPADGNGRLLGLHLQHCCMQENVSPTGPWALPQGAECWGWSPAVWSKAAQLTACLLLENG